MPKKHDILVYVDDVLKGRILSCKTVIQACERFKSDLKRKDVIFKWDHADHALKFFKFFKHSKGEHAGTAFILESWQKFIIGNLFGWYRKDGKRRFNYAYVEVPRKNGKTTLASGFAN